MASSRSIRFKISALLAIPLTSLVALWGFAATVTVGDSVSMLEADDLYDAVIAPANELSYAVEREHMLSAEYLAVRSEDARTALAAQRAVTDGERSRLRDGARRGLGFADLGTTSKARFADLTAAVDALDAVRAKVDGGRIGSIELAGEFGPVPEAFYRFIDIAAVADDHALSRQMRGVNTVGYSLAFFCHERALAAGALATGRRLTPAELRLFGQFATKRAFLMEEGMSQLDAGMRAPFAGLVPSSQPVRALTEMEGRLMSGGVVAEADWRAATDRLETAYQKGLSAAGRGLIDRATPAALSTFAKAGTAGALGLVAVIASLLVSYRIGRNLTRELAGVRRAAADLAEVRLPRVMERLRRGEPVDVAAEAPPLEPLGSTTEVHDVAAAFDSVQHRAVDAAVEQARLREAVAQSFRSLARRSQSLLQRQLKLLDGMQKQAEDPEALENLFRLDHLTTRMRRHAEGLVILSGGAAGRKWRSPVLIEDMLRGAAAQVEDYARVRIYPMLGATLAGDAVADMMHLFAEIIENATAFSPPGGEVSIRGECAGHRGFTVEVEDRGLGMTSEKRAAVNERLASPPEFDPAETDRLGFAVVGMLAARYGAKVTVRPSPYGGTGVVVLIPGSLLGEPHTEGQPPREIPEAGIGDEPAEAVRPAGTAGPGTAAGVTQSGKAGFAGTVRLAGTGEPSGPTGIVPSPEAAPRTPPANGLPRRIRRASPPRPSHEPDMSGQAGERSPEEARAVLSSLQAGWRRGRAEDGGEEH
ncbi:nitrate- and nitrite sensing domain-containing protein [Streptosporangium sp. NPDC004379]|uniref:sensor histidine kinase n=1 Tax=Streptosporangium sp. NPDC004379 TaxID=3366189 RepID=UPI0036B896F1